MLLVYIRTVLREMLQPQQQEELTIYEVIEKLYNISTDCTEVGCIISVSLHDQVENTYNIYVNQEFFINVFLNHKDSYLFELQEVYPSGTYGLSIYVKYIGA